MESIYYYVSTGAFLAFSYYSIIYYLKFGKICGSTFCLLKLMLIQLYTLSLIILFFSYRFFMCI